MVRLGVNRFDVTHKAENIEAWFIHNLIAMHGLMV